MTNNNGQPIQNHGVVTVTSGDTFQFKCRVDGGYPKVSRVTTSCGGTANNADNGVETTHTMNVEKKDNGVKCTCGADHVTGCYDKTSDFTLNVLYPPTVTLYKANTDSSELTVSAGDTVTFVCVAEGNSRPDVSVRGQRTKNIVTLQDTSSGSYGKRSQGTKTMSCKDTDVYTCTADNGVKDEASKTVSVFVKCVPELNSSSSDSRVKVYETLNGTDLTIHIPVIGYPIPKDFSLKKVTKENRRRRRAVNENSVDADMYHVIYEAGQAPEGRVVLWMFGLTSEDTGQYVLNIHNGIQSGLDYTFSISILLDKNSDNGCGGDDYNEGLEVGVGIGIGVTLAGVGLILLGVFVWKRVQMSRHVSQDQQQEPQQLQSQRQQQLQQQRERENQGQQHHQPPRYEQMLLDDYDTVSANDLRESQRKRERSEQYFPIVPANKKDTHYANSDVNGPDPSYANQDVNDGGVIKPDPNYANQDLGHVNPSFPTELDEGDYVETDTTPYHDYLEPSNDRYEIPRLKYGVI